MASGKQSLRTINFYLFIYLFLMQRLIYSTFSKHIPRMRKKKSSYSKSLNDDPFVEDEFSLQPCMIYPHRWKHEQIGNISDIN